ncbi:hypothetical protein [Erythrobacter litoralis]|uniref:Uncharacterized protein n=1 Tax=Erythrobacter litoralis (strain HTCC2594) TaxID=314225 RepID=Q2N939_ERYLH|nr:hypothetical protein [Erythrobacter litoralis]ABC63802.1 hypothetical protein ELI_08550 [Erythrobacter litoralis HTCC2594]
MPERQSRHPDNELIDEITSEKTPSQSSSSGGEVNTRVGSRAELHRATDPDNREPVVGSDNPEEDAMKGPKTMEKIKKGEAN